MGSLPTLLNSMLKVGSIGFGGGSAIIPVMEKEVVQAKRLLPARLFTSHAVIANVTPGAFPVKLAALAGAHTSRTAGALLASAMVALPGAVATVALLALFAAVGPQAVRYVEFAAAGIAAFIIVLLVNYIAKALGGAGHRRTAFLIVMLASFLLTGANQLIAVVAALVGRTWSAALPNLSAVQLVVGALLVIGVFSLFGGTKPPAVAVPVAEGPGKVAPALILLGVAAASVLVAVALGAGRFLGLVALSTVATFGGGAAYIGIAEGFFVANGLVDAGAFYGQMVPVANAMPGAIMVKLVSAMGFSYGFAQGGWGLAVGLATLSFVCCVALGAAVALLFMAGYDKASQSVFVRNLGIYILPVICGLLLTTSMGMILANIEIGGHADVPVAAMAWGSLAGILGLWALQRYARLSDLPLLAIGGLCSLIILLVV